MYQKIALTSKKNKVYRIIEGNKSYILKTFTDSKRFQKELEILKILDEKKILVPRILETNENTLALEDLGEATLLSTYEELEKNGDHNYIYIVESLLLWLQDFYKILEDYYGEKLILVDMNFRNFIVKDNKICRIDFEEVDCGKKESDIGKLLAFGLTYTPEFTSWKKTFAKDFTRVLKESGFYNMESVEMEKKMELERIRVRRG